MPFCKATEDMKGLALYRRPTGKWCVVEIPDGWRRTDPLPKDNLPIVSG